MQQLVSVPVILKPSPPIKTFCLTASRETLLCNFSAGEDCGNERKLETRFLEFFELLPTPSIGSCTLAVSIPPYTHQCKNLEVAEELGIFERRLFKKYKCYEILEWREKSCKMNEFERISN